MANRYWRISENMGYAGTDSSETVDILDYWGITEEELEGMTDKEISATLSQDAWNAAVEKVEAYVEPIDEDEME